MMLMNELLLNEIKRDNLSCEDARKMYEMIEREEIIKSYTFPTKTSSDGYYHIYVKDSSTKSGRRQFKSKTLDDLKEKVYQYEKGINGTVRKTFRDVFEIVQSQKLEYVKSKEKRLSVENTIIRTRSDYRRFFEETDFEDKYIDMISKKDIESICMKNLKRYDLRRKAFAGLRGILKSVFDLAFSEYWISDNIYTRVNFHKFSDMIVDDVPIEDRMHTQEELILILNELHLKQKKYPKCSSFFAMEFQIITGTRRGELPPLTWNNVDKDGIWITQSQISHENDFYIVGHTKNYRKRKFPMTDDLKNLLERMKEMHDKYYPNNNFLFPANTKSGTITNMAVYGVYRRVCRKLGIQISKDLIRGPHSFRRNAITDVANATNGNMVMASSLFGNSPQVAMSNYYGGANLMDAKDILEQRKYLRFG